MSKKHVLIGLLLLLLSGPMGLSHAAIFTEDFSSATGTGAILASPDNFSEKWSLTNYHLGLANATDWTFSGQAYLADNGTDKAILLNENPHGSMISKSITVTPNQAYVLTFDHWGDNRPGAPGYTFSVSIDGTPLSTISRSYNVPGSGAHASIPFTANGSSIQLSFLDSSSGYASPIIDNIGISAVPIPAAIWLLGAGLGGLLVVRRRFQK